MKHIKKSVSIIIAILFSVPIQANVTCTGTIEAIYKWNEMQSVSVMLSSTNRWVNMPTKSDESMALLAFASNKPVELYWSASDVTSCIDGWEHNRSLVGYWIVKK